MFALALLVQGTGAAMPEPAAAAPRPHAGIEEIMRVARQDLGKIDKELRDEEKEKEKGKEKRDEGANTPFSAAGDSAQQRLSKGIEEAHAAAPNKWYQAAKIEDFTPPGDDARKIYKVTTALGTYCVRYKDKNRAFNQGAANLGEPLIGACPHMFKGP